MEGSTRYPLEMLPIEMWEMIILAVKDSGDIRSFMKASKQLNDSLIRIHHLWLLDKVLPILVPTTKPKSKHYLEVKDVNNLRLVNKRWSRDVNSFLENQPKLRPYNESDDKLNSEEHICVSSKLCFGDELEEDLEMGSVTFSSYSNISRFNRTFRNSGEKNPFPSRSIVGKTQPDYTVYGPLEDDDEDDELKFWEEMNKEVFQKFGKHVWFLRMEWDSSRRTFWGRWEPEVVWKWVVDSISSLPNLKGLDLNFDFQHIKECSLGYCETREFLEQQENRLPPLNFLESLKINPETPLPNLFSQQLLSKYFGQLRRLQISISILETNKNWTFPNLTELGIDDITGSENVTEILASFEAPNLAKLQLRNLLMGDRCSKSIPLRVDVLKWIALFPKLLHLNMPCTGFYIGESEKPKCLSVPLKYLKIGQVEDPKYKFLRYLPNLQQLHICLNSCMEIDKLFSKLEVWELCPKLRTVRVTRHFSRKYCKEFHRETYEKLEKSADLTRSVQEIEF